MSAARPRSLPAKAAGTTTLMALAFALVSAAVVSACGDTRDVTTLTVVETVPVDFGDMAGGVAEFVSVALAPLQEDANYQEISGAISCAVIDEGSRLVVDRLVVGPGATVLEFMVEVSAGDGFWVPLVDFDGSVVHGESLDFFGREVVLAPDGRKLVEELAREGTTALGMRVTALVPGAVEDLQISTYLHLRFSTEVGGCD